MHAFRRWIPAVLAAVLGAGCSDSGPTEPDDVTAELAAVDAEAAAQAPINLGGDWTWTREETLTVPADFAFIFGIAPEGPVTHFTCDIEGVITLVQDGSDLSGVEVETGSLCETRGGQVFVQPGLGVQIPIPEGRVVGRHVELVIGDPVLSCPIRAVITESDGATALSMRGTGRCIIPGHPKSDAPEGSPLDLDPPPAGTEKILTWEANRV